MTQRETLINALRIAWISNNGANLLVNSSRGARTIRDIRSNPPKGERVDEMWRDNPVRHKMFRLVKIDNLQL